MSTTDYDNFVNEKRKMRENLVNSYRKENSQDDEIFKYFPIDKKWSVTGEVKLRKPKEGVSDFKLNFTRIGVIKFTLMDIPHKFDLLQLEGSEDLYIFMKDGTSGKTTYGLGRFVPVFKIENDEYNIDFNLSYTPACGHVEGSACPWARENSTIAIEAGEMAPDH